MNSAHNNMKNAISSFHNKRGVAQNTYKHQHEFGIFLAYCYIIHNNIYYYEKVYLDNTTPKQSQESL